MEIIVKLVQMGFEVGRNGQDHLRKRDFAGCRGTQGKFGLKKRFKVHDCRYRAKTDSSLSQLLSGVF